jgi:hypothetical protein
MRVEQPLAGGHVHASDVGRWSLTAGEPQEHRQDCLDGCQHVGLGAAEGGEPRLCKPRLQRPQIAAAEREVMKKISRTVRVLWMHVLQQIGGFLDKGQHFAADTFELIDELGQSRFCTAGIRHLFSAVATFMLTTQDDQAEVEADPTI